MNEHTTPCTWRLACLLFLATSSVSLADMVSAEAPPSAAQAVMCSASGRYCLHGPPLQQNLTMFRMDRGQATPVWTAPGEAAHYMVAEDGEHYVRIPLGQTRLALGGDRTSPRRVMFVFYARERELARVTLGQLIHSISQLSGTISHRTWARDFGFAPDGKFVIRTVENRTFVFDPTTGALLGEGATTPN